MLQWLQVEATGRGRKRIEMMSKNLNDLKVGDKVQICTVKSCRETVVIRVTKTRVVVNNDFNPHTSYQTFRKNDGKDFGPTTSNVFFLKF